MASSIFQLFHRRREDLWDSKALGVFALKLLLATVRVPKGATRGSIVQKKPLFHISVWAVWRGVWGQSARSAKGTHPSHCCYPAIALVRHWSDTALACLGTIVCAHLLFVLFVCCPDGWKSKLVLLPYSIHLSLKRYLYLQLSVPLQSTLTMTDTVHSLRSNRRF